MSGLTYPFGFFPFKSNPDGWGSALLYPSSYSLYAFLTSPLKSPSKEYPGSPFFDRRRTDDLGPKQFKDLPIPALELQTIGAEVYTTGGI